MAVKGSHYANQCTDCYQTHNNAPNEATTNATLAVPAGPYDGPPAPAQEGQFVVGHADGILGISGNISDPDAYVASLRVAAETALASARAKAPTTWAITLATIKSTCIATMAILGVCASLWAFFTPRSRG